MLKIGWHENLSMDEYHGDRKSFSKSSICDFEKLGAYKFNYNRVNAVKKSSNAFDLGTAAHCAILEPHKFNSEIVTAPNINKNTKEYKSFVAANAGKIIISDNEMVAVSGMRDAVMSHEIASQFFQSGVAEISGIFQHESGLTLKFRPDYYIKDAFAIIDLKTTSVFADFERQAYNLHYHWSAWLSTKGVLAITGVPHDYYFVVVDVQPPHEVVVFKTPEWMIDAAFIEAKPVIEDLAECVKTGVWPQKHSGLQWLDAPEWVKRKYYVS